jgi:Fe-Mn family superoxide dismutase
MKEYTMNDLTRRTFLFASTGAAAGSLAATGLTQETDQERLDFSRSGLATGKPKPLKHTEVPGFLSAEQIAPHHSAHYGGALKAMTGADARLEEAIQASSPLDPAAFGQLKRIINSRGNSVLLHEMYFDGLAPEAADPTADVRRAIEMRFGSLDKWWADFAASAKEASGWAMLVRHPVNGRLYNVVSDEHAMGLLWMAVPLVVIDVYEHAYYIDYQNRKADYVDKFRQHTDWTEVGARFQHAAQS